MIRGQSSYRVWRWFNSPPVPLNSNKTRESDPNSINDRLFQLYPMICNEPRITRSPSGIGVNGNPHTLQLQKRLMQSHTCNLTTSSDIPASPVGNHHDHYVHLSALQAVFIKWNFPQTKLEYPKLNPGEWKRRLMGIQTSGLFLGKASGIPRPFLDRTS